MGTSTREFTGAAQPLLFPDLSRRDSISVAWIQHRLTDVLQPQHLGGQSFQTDRQATMWRHPQFKHPKMAFKALRIHAAFTEGILQVFPVMQALATGGDLHATKQQIETLGGPLASPGRGIKWPTGNRESNDENDRDSCFLLGEGAQLPLPLRIEIIPEVRPSEVLFQKLKTSAEFPCRHVKHRGK